MMGNLEMTREAVFLHALVKRQIAMSDEAFGPGPRSEGIHKHIHKELEEIAADPLDVLEWIDVVILGLDGAWRAVRESAPWLDHEDLAVTIAKALQYKIGINEEREWPDWRTVGQDQPIEHERSSSKVCFSCGGGGVVNRTIKGGLMGTCPDCEGTGRTPR